MTYILDITLISLMIIGAYLSFKNKGVFQKVISITLIIGALLTFDAVPILIVSSIIITLIVCIVIMGYGITNNSLNPFLRMCISTAGLFYSIGTIFKIGHYPYQELFHYALLIPIISLLIYTISRPKEPAKEVGFAVIMVGFCVARLGTLLPIDSLSTWYWF